MIEEQPNIVSDALAYREVSFDAGTREAKRLLLWYNEHRAKRNEATTRRHLIDHMFFDCLGWLDEDAQLEERLSTGAYTDYTFSITRPLLIVEAKRDGAYFEIPASKSSRELTLGSLKRGNEALSAAIKQATEYCLARGVQYAVVTNGNQLAAFAAIRTDGLGPDDGRCFVVNSLDEFSEHFVTVWNLLSRTAVAKQSHSQYFLGVEPARIPSKLSRLIADYPGTKARNPFQADLQAVSELVLEDLVRNREIEADFLAECYCETGALAQYSLSARDILRARYHAVFTTVDPGPALEPIQTKGGTIKALEAFSTRPVLLIGDVGVGKTTFIKHLLVSNDDVIQHHTLIVYLDLGSGYSLTENLRTATITAIESQLYDKYNINIQEDSFARGVYHGELLKFSGSIYKRDRDANPERYRKREVNFLEQKIYGERSSHLAASLRHIVAARNQQVIIVIDNCDQRSEADQEEAFLIAQEMASQWPAVVFIALRPETFHASRRRGALTGYHAKAYSISPPRLDRVIRRRLHFALKIAAGNIPLSRRYAQAIVQFATLSVLMRTFLSSLDRNPDLMECIENVSGGNVRLALDMIRHFLGSGHVNTRKIVDIAEEQGYYVIPLHEFLRAIIFGDNVYYNAAESPAMNLFDVQNADAREHFLQLLCLATLSIKGQGPAAERGFVKTPEIYEAVRGVGFTAEQIDAALMRLIAKRLAESAARRVPTKGERPAPSLRITSIGLYHFVVMSKMFVYYDAILIDTPIFDDATRASLAESQTLDQSLDQRLEHAEKLVCYFDEVWRTLPPQSVALVDWPTMSAAVRTNIAAVRRNAQRTRGRQSRDSSAM